MGQFIHDEVTQQTSIVDADFQFLNGCAFDYAESQVHQLHFCSGLPHFRVIEHKPIGRELSQAQKWVTFQWRELIKLGIRAGQVNRASGVFIVEADPPFSDVVVTKIGRDSANQLQAKWTREEFVRWMGGPRRNG